MRRPRGSPGSQVSRSWLSKIIATRNGVTTEGQPAMVGIVESTEQAELYG